MASDEPSPEFMEQLVALLEKQMAEEAAEAAKNAPPEPPKPELSPKEQLRRDAMIAWMRTVWSAYDAIPPEALGTDTLTESDSRLIWAVHRLASHALYDAPPLVQTVELIDKILSSQVTGHGLRDARIAHACELVKKHRDDAATLVRALYEEADPAFKRIEADDRIPVVQELLSRYAGRSARGKLTATAILVELNKMATANERDGGPLGHTAWFKQHNVSEAAGRGRNASRKK